jgi:uncharacterized protein Veg
VKRPQTLESAKEIIDQLKGKNVTVRCNRGRNRINSYSGTLSEVYSNVFVVTLYNELFDRLSCSYNEVVCGEISVKER